MKKKIDDFFKKELNKPQEAPADAWDFIQKHIAQKEKKRIFPFWMKISGIAALFVLFTGTVYFFNSEWIQSNNLPENNSETLVKNPNHSNSGLIEHEIIKEKNFFKVKLPMILDYSHN